MKKIISLATAFVVCLSACKKDQSITTDSQCSLEASVLDSTLVSRKGIGTTLQPYDTTIIYSFTYNANGNLELTRSNNSIVEECVYKNNYRLVRRPVAPGQYSSSHEFFLNENGNTVFHRQYIGVDSFYIYTDSFYYNPGNQLRNVISYTWKKTNLQQPLGKETTHYTWDSGNLISSERSGRTIFYSYYKDIPGKQWPGPFRYTISLPDPLINPAHSIITTANFPISEKLQFTGRAVSDSSEFSPEIDSYAKLKELRITRSESGLVWREHDTTTIHYYYHCK